MAKLGGIKFGAPPATRKQSSLSPGPPQSPLEEPTSPLEAPMSPVKVSSSITEDVTEEATAAAPPMGDDETPDQESARRRATLARLRAGGTLGFGMFGHGPAAISASDDTRGLEQELETQEAEAAPPPPPAPSKRTSLPPPPADEGPRSPPYSPRQSLPPPPPVEEEEDAPPPPVSAVRPPQPTTSPVPLSPSTPTRRPPIPASEKRYSQHQPHPIAIPEDAPPPPSQSFDSQLVNEPAVMMMNQQSPVSPPLPPPLPPISTRPHTQPESPRRSMSAASRISRTSTTEHSPVLPHGSPASRQPSRQEAFPTPEQPVEAPRPSMNQGRPGYDQLVAASRDGGARLARAAKAMFDQGKRGHFGDGSSAGFVMVAIDQAQLARPTQEWGQVVFEQEGSSVMKRYDEPRPGDIAAFYDAKLKGKKGLAGYSQHVGSVEEPLLGVVVEFESKHKQKMRVLQVERGVPEEVSYRCEDLKSGKVIVYRVGL
ncbi:hypothetical protein BCR39DRAFT_543513 [Naematelia encephala]|uniref:BBC1/AIM3 cysteine proteinase-fold domain-containing protein n=1 Tax=Naematelia encephala TaxID=71784 RepID=A0A1Y2ASW3_9TREE|nr:hypothetical protein BCR39DRAFT_543513 [Naematelia encephala]